ncbi:quinol oxidase subunit 4 [Chryseobacterium sp.]|uniref:quinol oxidase subunit 4 n=1 Tax=Chryseobacterium sp. TaxID=1871047 RepID=UPI0025BA2A7E|nr:quinol oxidase subunit 4 [Chryseobacterium sp.]MBV8327570.1 quinol oxidase subunit 4 [Chryseobacterium sp.]
MESIVKITGALLIALMLTSCVAYDNNYGNGNGAKKLPPGQAKKIYGGSAKDYAPGQVKKNNGY